MGSPINFHNIKFEIGSTICVIGDRSTSTSRSQLANWTPQNTGLPRAPIRKQSIGKIFLEIKSPLETDTYTFYLAPAVGIEPTTN